MLIAVFVFFESTLKHTWGTFDLLQKLKRPKTIPTILEREDVLRIINHFHAPQLYTWYLVVYSCGLRMSEALSLTINDIDATRNRLIVRGGKGRKDREIPLPNATLNAIRKYWKSHRNPKYLFPARGRGNNKAQISNKPMASSSVQKPLRIVLKELGITKKITTHTFRHSYATHLLDAGVSIRHVQLYLGHANVETTCIYLHLTKDASGKALILINNLMGGFKDGEDKPNI